jgi:uncharacterized protein with PIN domain
MTVNVSSTNPSPVRSSESRCPNCSTLLTKVSAKVEQGSLTKEQFDTFKKGARFQLAAQTKCRKCKCIVSTAIATNVS